MNEHFSINNQQTRLEGEALKNYTLARAEEAMARRLSLERERIGDYVRENLESQNSLEKYFDITETEEWVIDALLEKSEGSLDEITQEMIDKGIRDFIAVSIKAEIESKNEEIYRAVRRIGKRAMSKAYARESIEIPSTNRWPKHDLSPAELPSLPKSIAPPRTNS